MYSCGRWVSARHRTLQATSLFLRCFGRCYWPTRSVVQSASKYARHNVINDLIARAVTLADIPCVKESQGLSRSDGKRPDEMTLIPWKAGKCSLWDVTVIDTIAQSHVSQSSQCAGSAAELAATRKS